MAVCVRHDFFNLFLFTCRSQITQTIRLTISNDDLPELSEQFDVILLNDLPLSDDGLVGSTNTSGASIETNGGMVNTVTVAQSDSPHGLFQFSLEDPPGLSDPVVKPANFRIDLDVPENVGVAQLLVVRAQGLLGAVSLEWRTIDGSAVSAGKNPVDFMVSYSVYKEIRGRKKI